jgi:hypothetical protein
MAKVIWNTYIELNKITNIVITCSVDKKYLSNLGIPP